MFLPHSNTDAATKAKMVRFSAVSALVFIPRCPASKKTSAWYTKEDERRMKAEHDRHAIDTMFCLKWISSQQDAGIHLSEFSEKLDFFGIENLLTAELVQKRISSRRQVRHAVLYEQARQRRSKEYNPVLLARASWEQTKWSADRARTIGLLQSQSAQNEHR